MSTRRMVIVKDWFEVPVWEPHSVEENWWGVPCDVPTSLLEEWKAVQDELFRVSQEFKKLAVKADNERP